MRSGIEARDERLNVQTREGCRNVYIVNPSKCPLFRQVLYRCGPYLRCAIVDLGCVVLQSFDQQR